MADDFGAPETPKPDETPAQGAKQTALDANKAAVNDDGGAIPPLLTVVGHDGTTRQVSSAHLAPDTLARLYSVTGQPAAPTATAIPVGESRPITAANPLPDNVAAALPPVGQAPVPQTLADGGRQLDVLAAQPQLGTAPAPAPVAPAAVAPVAAAPAGFQGAPAIPVDPLEQNLNAIERHGNEAAAKQQKDWAANSEAQIAAVKETARVETAKQEAALLIQQNGQKVADDNAADQVRLHAERQGYIDKQKSVRDSYITQQAGKTFDPERMTSGAYNGIVSAVSIALGSLGQALTHSGSNTALTIVNDKIARDIEQQKEDYRRGEQNVANSTNDYRYFVEHDMNETQAANAAAAVALERVKNHVAVSNAQFGGQEVAARAQQLTADITKQQLEHNGAFDQQAQARALEIHGMRQTAADFKINKEIALAAAGAARDKEMQGRYVPGANGFASNDANAALMSQATLAYKQANEAHDTIEKLSSRTGVWSPAEKAQLQVARQQLVQAKQLQMKIRGGSEEAIERIKDEIPDPTSTDLLGINKKKFAALKAEEANTLRNSWDTYMVPGQTMRQLVKPQFTESDNEGGR